MNEIKPIETVYNGYRFRSRLEARWAVFFDMAGIKYLYEPEGYQLSDGTRYLPDFYLPELLSRHDEKGIYVEVKGELTPEDLHKVELFSLEKPIIILRNLPDHGCIDLRDGAYEDTDCGDIGTFGYIDDDWYPAHFFKRSDGKIALCGPDNDWYYNQHGGYEGFHWFDDKFDKARQARFEYGESSRGTA